MVIGKTQWINIKKPFFLISKIKNYTLYNLKNNISITSIPLDFITQHNKSTQPKYISSVTDNSRNIFSNIIAIEKIKVFPSQKHIYFLDNTIKGETIIHTIEKSGLKYLNTKKFSSSKDTSMIQVSNAWLSSNVLIQADLSTYEFCLTFTNLDSSATTKDYCFSNTNTSVSFLKSRLNWLKKRLNTEAPELSIKQLSNPNDFWTKIEQEGFFVGGFAQNDTLNIRFGSAYLKNPSFNLPLFLLLPVPWPLAFAMSIHTPVYSAKHLSSEYNMKSIFYEAQFTKNGLKNIPFQSLIIEKNQSEEKNFNENTKLTIFFVVTQSDRRVYVCYNKKTQSLLFVSF